MSDYKATDQDLPIELFEKLHQPNQLTRAKDRIRSVAAEMGIKLDAEQIEIFAIILIGLATER
jgi:hypothetical protein